MCALPEHELKQPWVRRGVESVAQDLIDNRKTPCDCGPLFHALHALKMFNYRANPLVKNYSDRPPIKVEKEGENASSSDAPAPPVPTDAITAEPGDKVRK